MLLLYNADMENLNPGLAWNQRYFYDSIVSVVDWVNQCRCMLLIYNFHVIFQNSGGMSNSQSAHDVSACDDDDGYGEIGVYARRTGTLTAHGDILSGNRLSVVTACSLLSLCMPVVHRQTHTP